jgi:hypothetical protein
MKSTVPFCAGDPHDNTGPRGFATRTSRATVRGEIQIGRSRIVGAEAPFIVFSQAYILLFWRRLSSALWLGARPENLRTTGGHKPERGRGRRGLYDGSDLASGCSCPLDEG